MYSSNISAFSEPEVLFVSTQFENCTIKSVFPIFYHHNYSSNYCSSLINIITTTTTVDDGSYSVVIPFQTARKKLFN